MSKMNLSNFTTDELIDALPPNRPLYKDSDLWAIRTDDMEDVYMDQHHNESFRQFIERYINWLVYEDKNNSVDLLLKIG